MKRSLVKAAAVAVAAFVAWSATQIGKAALAMTFPFPMYSPSSTAAAAVFEVCGHASSTTSAVTITFTAVNIGTANANRLVVVTVSSRGLLTGSARTISSATIGGIAATKVVEVTNGSQQCASAIISAVVPTGTTGDIVINFNARPLCTVIQAYATVPASTTAVNTNSNTASSSVNSLSLAAVAKAGGSYIVAASTRLNVTFTGSTAGSETIVEDYDTAPRSDYAAVSYHSLPTADGTPTVTVTQDAGASNPMCVCVATFQ